MAGTRKIQIGAAVIALAMVMLAANAMAMTVHRATMTAPIGGPRRWVQDFRLITAFAIRGLNGNTIYLMRRPALDLADGKVGWRLGRAD
jgi:hypothetical protein